LKNVQKVEEMKTEKNKIVNVGKPKKTETQKPKRKHPKKISQNKKNKKKPIGPRPEA
jgi:hypothetical protein